LFRNRQVIGSSPIVGSILCSFIASEIMRPKPAEHSITELLLSGIDDATVTSIRYLPKSYFALVAGVNPFRLLGRDVVVRWPMNQENH
jgi:hypothetical protein